MEIQVSSFFDIMTIINSNHQKVICTDCHSCTNICRLCFAILYKYCTSYFSGKVLVTSLQHTPDLTLRLIDHLLCGFLSYSSSRLVPSLFSATCDCLASFHIISPEALDESLYLNTDNWLRLNRNTFAQSRQSILGEKQAPSLVTLRGQRFKAVQQKP